MREIEERPRTVAVLLVEGGTWVLWDQYAPVVRERHAVHAIAFSNGLVWDAFNGWRERPIDITWLEETLKHQSMKAVKNG